MKDEAYVCFGRLEKTKSLAVEKRLGQGRRYI